ICRFMIASVYVWSGLQKMNANFISTDFPWVLRPFLEALPWLNHKTILYGIGAVVPIVEVSMGLGLLTQKFRYAAMVTALLMHSFILTTLILLGYNSVVWPWNIAMVMMVLILFWRVEGLTLKEVVANNRLPVYKAAFILFGVMPAFSFFNLWDSYLSFALYS